MISKHLFLFRLGLPALILFGLPMLALLFINLSWFDEDLNGDISNSAGSANRTAIDELSGDTNPDQHWLDQYPAVSCNSRSQQHCLTRLQQQIAEAPVNDERLILMLDRYRTIRNSRSFSEFAGSQPGTLPFPHYGRLLQLARMNTAIHLSSEGPGSALTEMAADRAFWQLMLSEGDSMMAHMVAVSGLWTQLQFVAEIVAAETLTPEHLDLADQIVQPLSAQAQDLSTAFAAEQRQLPATLVQLRSQAGLIKRMLLAVSTQPNATLNRYYDQVTQPMMQLAKESPGQFKQLVEKGVAAEFDYRIFPPGLYNLGGTMLLQSFRSHQGWDYIGRMHDLQGMLGLVRLQIEIEQARNRATTPFNDEAIQRLIDGSSARNPYTREAVDWNREGATLSFDCFGESLCQISL